MQDDELGFGWVAEGMKPNAEVMQSDCGIVRLDDAVPDERYIGRFLTPVFLSSRAT